MGKIKLSQYRVNVRGLVSDSAYDLTLVDQAINWFLNEVHSGHRIRYLETNDQLSILAGDTSTDWPIDFSTKLSLSMISPQVRPLDKGYVEYEDFMLNYTNYLTAVPNQIYQWTDYGSGIRFSVPSKTDATLNLDYLRFPKRLVNENDTTDMPDVYEELISKGALARLMEINEDYAEAQTERDNLTLLLNTFIVSEGRGGAHVGPTVMRTNRGRMGRGAWRADRDF